MPDAKKAVYGLAASQAISNLNLNIKDKLLYVATVPQSASYVVSGEVDAGFVNSSEALSIKDKIEQILTVKSELYSEISIVALKLDSCDKSAICKDFVEYLKSKRAKEIILKYGL
ncbi:molybdate ABC transporter substrate-binding protein [Campylobacter ureolyticus]|nr:molybdate ABC transporter substrate-binding protein [Campylobacter ureolyticus]MCZ6134606.1 molybdate ABC transporter substrate-binding protein [Campylobacter ureolyticus]